MIYCILASIAIFLVCLLCQIAYRLNDRWFMCRAPGTSDLSKVRQRIAALPSGLQEANQVQQGIARRQDYCRLFQSRQAGWN